MQPQNWFLNSGRPRALPGLCFTKKPDFSLASNKAPFFQLHVGLIHG